MTLEWIDTHTHLEFEYPFSIEEYLTNAREQGVNSFVTIGTTPSSLKTIATLSEKYKNVYFTIGIHPHEAKDFNPEVEREMEQLHRHPKCVAIGEIGLDYFYKHSPPDVQKQVLEKQLELALKWKKPVVIHSRDAEEDLAEKMTSYSEKLNHTPGIIHCFSGSKTFAQTCLKLGFYISFSGILTFKTADTLREIAKNVPLDRCLLETDAPFLAPIPYRGKPNQSAYMIETAKCLAQVKNLSLEELSKATVANSKRIFGIT